MAGVGIGELVWLIMAVLLGLGVVIAWIIKAEISRNVFKTEIKKLKGALDGAGREKFIMLEQMHAAGAPASGSEQGLSDPEDGKIVIAKMAKKAEELENDNARLKQELNEARSSLEEVYKALVQ